MCWHVLGKDHFDLSRIVSALEARGTAEDLNMMRVIEKMQNAPPGSRAGHLK